MLKKAKLIIFIALTMFAIVYIIGCFPDDSNDIGERLSSDPALIIVTTSSSTTN